MFVHGLLGFACLGFTGNRICYFRGIERRLEASGFSVHFPALPPAGSVAERAGTLARYMAGVESERIHIVAHSMGGLDARHYIHRLDPERRVQALVTVGTPHHGTPLASWVLEGRGRFARFLRRLTLPAVCELTPSACERFNSLTPDRPDVCYQSFAGSRPTSEMPPWFRAWARMLDERAGANDSQVPVASARWGRFRGTLRADHLELVGWSLAPPAAAAGRPFDHMTLYREIAASLTAADGRGASV